jgi:hypothetical protein
MAKKLFFNLSREAAAGAEAAAKGKLKKSFFRLREMMLPHLAGGYGYHPEGRKSFGQAFSKACGIQRQSLWSLPQERNTPCRPRKFTKIFSLFCKIFLDSGQGVTYNVILYQNA